MEEEGAVALQDVEQIQMVEEGKDCVELVEVEGGDGEKQ